MVTDGTEGVREREHREGDVLSSPAHGTWCRHMGAYARMENVQEKGHQPVQTHVDIQGCIY
jgi:hypothetical protein